MACVTEDDQLFKICQSGDLDAFKVLYNGNNSILDRKISGLEETPLHLASRFKHMVLVREILKYRNHMAKARNDEGDTPLHVACRQGERDIVEELLKACSSLPYILNKDKQSALFLGCSCGHKDLASLLCDRMIFSGRDGISASCLRIASSKGYKDIVQKILEENPSMASRKDDYGFSAMHLASREGKDEVIRTLIEKDSNLRFLKDNDERTPLHLAVITNQLSIVDALLSSTSLNSVQVADLINGADKDGNTVLHLAAINDNLEAIKLLLTKRPIKVNDANNEGMTALDILEKNQPSEAEEDSSGAAIRAEIIKQLKDRNRPDPISQTTLQETSLNNMQQALMTSLNDMQQELIKSLKDMQQALITSLKDMQKTSLNNMQQAPVSQTEQALTVSQIEQAQTEQAPTVSQTEQAPTVSQTEQALTVSQTTMQETSPNNMQQALVSQTEQVLTVSQTEQPPTVSQTTMQEPSLNNMQQALMVVAVLIVTLTFQAGLNPPGGVWQDSEQGNQTNHKPGKAIQSETNLWLFTVFLAFNALGFILSLALIPLIMILQTYTLRYVNSLVVMALVSVEFAFIIGLIMISDRKPFYHVEIFLLIFVTLAGIGWATWKHA